MAEATPTLGAALEVFGALGLFLLGMIVMTVVISMI